MARATGSIQQVPSVVGALLQSPDAVVLMVAIASVAGLAAALSWAPYCRVLRSWPSCCQLPAAASWASLWLWWS